MIRSKLLHALALTSLLLALPIAAPAKNPPGKPAAGATTEQKIPYAGTIESVDKDKQTFTFKEAAGERTFVVTATTKIENVVSKQPAKFEDLAAGTYITGSYVKAGDALNAYSVHLGKSAPAPAAAKGKKGAATATPAAKQ